MKATISEQCQVEGCTTRATTILYIGNHSQIRVCEYHCESHTPTEQTRWAQERNARRLIARNPARPAHLSESTQQSTVQELRDEDILQYGDE